MPLHRMMAKTALISRITVSPRLLHYASSGSAGPGSEITQEARPHKRLSYPTCGGAGTGCKEDLGRPGSCAGGGKAIALKGRRSEAEMILEGHGSRHGARSVEQVSDGGNRQGKGHASVNPRRTLITPGGGASQSYRRTISQHSGWIA
jgi:hypothetical protein